VAAQLAYLIASLVAIFAVANSDCVFWRGAVSFSPFGWRKDVPVWLATEGFALNGQRSVLIVDGSQETREVLQTVLERRGVRTLAAGRAAKGLEMVRRHHPDLVVLDLEMEGLPAEQFCGAGVTPANSDAGGTPAIRDAGETPAPQYQPQFVLLGSLRRQGNDLPGSEFVAKPYQYGPLIRKIEELLDNVRESGPCRHCSSSAESTQGAASN
jgi:CheY-like chemotaxis protein